ncbi:hypothetical protein BMETH_994_0 [methanotrophic bacterial endosymbiont of Bathymodiolus sp.]|nr:hypothetical protein BMETH_994_0 [methanotrophic bacterial endosymbiont of Bathymodiolus sp.]
MLVPLDLLPSVCQVVVPLGLAASVFLLDVRARVCKSSLPVPAAAGLALRLNWLQSPLCLPRLYRACLCSSLPVQILHSSTVLSRGFRKVWVPLQIGHFGSFYSFVCSGLSFISHNPFVHGIRCE